MTQPNSGPPFSYAKLAFFSIGAASLVLLLTTFLVGMLQDANTWVLLAVALAGVFGAIAAMGTVATRMTNKAFPKAPERGDQPPTQ